MARTKQGRPAGPPELAEIRRELKFGGWQLAGLGLIAIVPVLAAFEAFGEGSATVAQIRPTLAVVVEYPARMRHGTPGDVTVMATNRSPAMLDTLTVRFDSNYVARFSEPQFLPSAGEAYEVELADLGPGETRAIRLGLRGSDYGRHRGRIAAFSTADTASVTVSTIVFP